MVVVAALAGSALEVLVEQAAMAVGASTTWGAPRGSPSVLVVVALGTDLVPVLEVAMELEVAMALEVEPGVDLVWVVELVVALGLAVALALVSVVELALEAPASLSVPLEASKRSQSTRIF